MSKPCFQCTWNSKKEEAYSYFILNWTITHLPENMLHPSLDAKLATFVLHVSRALPISQLALNWLFQCPFKVTSQIVLGPHRWRVVVSRRNASWGVPHYLLLQTTQQQYTIGMRCYTVYVNTKWHVRCTRVCDLVSMSVPKEHGSPIGLMSYMSALCRHHRYTRQLNWHQVFMFKQLESGP